MTLDIYGHLFAAGDDGGAQAHRMVSQKSGLLTQRCGFPFGLGIKRCQRSLEKLSCLKKSITSLCLGDRYSVHEQRGKQ
jgi:hypothetical protein